MADRQDLGIRNREGRASGSKLAAATPTTHYRRLVFVPHFPLAYRGELMYRTLGYRGERVSKPSDLVQGTLDLLLLKILALQPMNGWAVSLRLKQISGDVLQVSD